jgi:predicted neutral ceramidase superfamily lipid hydrolase
MNLQTKYFIIAVVIIGSTGIWLPIGLEFLINKKITFHNIPPNLTTYFVSLLFAGSIDYLLGKIRNISIEGFASLFLNIISLLGIGLILVGGAIISNIYDYDFISFLIGVIGVFVSYRVWWLANIDNPNFSTGTPILGGEPENKLANGK